MVNGEWREPLCHRAFAVICIFCFTAKTQGRKVSRRLSTLIIHYSLFTIHYSLFTIHYSPFTSPLSPTKNPIVTDRVLYWRTCIINNPCHPYQEHHVHEEDRKSTRLNSSHITISY